MLWHLAKLLSTWTSGNKYYPRFEIAFDGLNGDIDVPIDSPIVFTKNPSRKPGNIYEEGETVVALTGGGFCGDPPVVSRARFQTKAPGDTTWTDQPGPRMLMNEEYSFVVQPGTEFIRFEQVEETEKGRTTSEFNKFKASVEQCLRLLSSVAFTA